MLAQILLNRWLLSIQRSLHQSPSKTRNKRNEAKITMLPKIDKHTSIGCSGAIGSFIADPSMDVTCLQLPALNVSDG